MKDHKKLSKEFFDMQASIYDDVEEAGGNARSVYPAIIKLSAVKTERCIHKAQVHEHSAS